MTVATGAYGMLYDAGNAKVIARAKAVSDDKWNTLDIITLPARTPLNAWAETVLLCHVEKVVGGAEPFRENYVMKLWKDGGGKLYIVKGHTRAAMYYALDKPMPVRIMDEKSLAERGGGDDYDPMTRAEPE